LPLHLPPGLEPGGVSRLDDDRRAIDQAAMLGATCFVLVVGSLPAGSKNLDGARDQVAAGVELLLQHARGGGVRLALEPLHPMYANDRSCLNTLAQTLDLAEALELANPEAPMLGVALDVYHVWWDPDLSVGIKRMGEARRIFALHVCDWLVPTRDLLNDRGMMGDGVVDIPRIRNQVEAAGYSGQVEVEIFSAMDWWTRPIEEILAVCAQRLQSVC
jgi:sugar phosphate isomerase/epimerase